MTDDAWVALNESADCAMDNYEQPMADWEPLIKEVIEWDISTFWLQMVNLPEIGPMIRSTSFYMLAIRYDVLMNFVECSEKAQKSI